ncbi:MAG: hypothetical protein GX555_00730 [Actinomycetales bacterium]|nr:hypothetical protein [Actinomycetales bacterium]
MATDLQNRYEKVRETSKTPTKIGEGPRLLGIVVGVAALLALVVTAFSWPVLNSAPREVPVAVAAPAPAVEALSAQLSAVAGAGAFEVTPVDDRAAAEQAIRDREVYGAIVLGPDGGEVLTASGASPAIAQSLAQLAANAPEQVGGPFAVTDLAPLPDADPRGAGLGSAVLPLVIAGLVSGAVSGLAVRGRGRQLATLAALAVVGGLVVTGVVQVWLGAIPGSAWVNAGVLALGIAAIGAVALGLVRAIGVPGVGLTALVMVLLGSPLSGAQSAPEMLPAGWGTLGQLLPPGATGTALRSVAWFDGAGSGSAFLVLGCWLLVGLLLLLPARTSRAGAQPLV